MEKYLRYNTLFSIEFGKNKERSFMQIFKELVFSLKETFYKHSLRYENISVTFCAKTGVFLQKKWYKEKKGKKIILSEILTPWVAVLLKTIFNNLLFSWSTIFTVALWLEFKMTSLKRVISDIIVKLQEMNTELEN